MTINCKSRKDFFARELSLQIQFRKIGPSSTLLLSLDFVQSHDTQDSNIFLRSSSAAPTTLALLAL